jgi:hypothetical protein
MLQPQFTCRTSYRLLPMINRHAPVHLHMLILSLALLLLAHASRVSAQTDSIVQTLRGTVVDAVTSAPLAVITVRVVGSDSTMRGGYTDTRGRFRVSRLPVGRHE